MYNQDLAYDYNKTKSLRLLELIKIKEILRNWFSELIIDLDKSSILPKDIFDTFPNLKRTRNNFVNSVKKKYINKIKPTMDDYYKLTDQVAYEQTLISIVTTLESFFRDKYLQIKNDDKTNYSFQRIDKIEEAFSEFRLLIFKNEQEKANIGFILQIRHILVHNAGKINTKFLNNCTKFDLWKSNFSGNKNRFTKGREIKFLLTYEFLLQVYQYFMLYLDRSRDELNKYIQQSFSKRKK